MQSISPSRWRHWPVMSETQRFLLLAILIGLFAGLFVVCFHVTMNYLSWLILDTPVGKNRLLTVLGPAFGAMLSSLLVIWVFKSARGSGVNHTKAAIYISDGYVPPSAVIGKFIACSISIGSGNSLGPEDPALHMGAGIASWLGRLFGLARKNMRMISAVGASAGIAAAFNTPITAVLFVIEVVMGKWNTAVLGSTILSSVSAVVVSRWFLGDEPLFRVPDFQLTHISELAIYAVIGLVGGLLSALFVRLMHWFHKRFQTQPPSMSYFRPFLAGLLVGCVGIFLPDVMGAGYGTIDRALHNQFPWHMLLLLGVMKMIVTLVCFSAGTPGGMLAPALVTGAMIGGGLGGVANLHWPFPSSSTDAYVLVGMGTFFAGLFRAPMTSVFMVFEVSASYLIIVPVMIANTIAYLVSRKLQPVPFFSLVARLEGMNLPSPEQQREERVLCVEDAMQWGPVPVLQRTVSVEQARVEMVENKQQYAFVLNQLGAWSTVVRERLESAEAEDQKEKPLSRVLDLPSVPALHPDLSLDRALRQFGGNRILPVTSRLNPKKILGTLTLSDVHSTYGIDAALFPLLRK